MARALVDAAAAAGADAVKFQTFQADALVSRDAPKAAYQQRTDGAHRSQHEMLRALELDADATAAIQAHAHQRGLLFLSTPFDRGSIELLRRLAVPACKVSSADLTNHLLLRDVAAWGVPVILSTGMATLDEVAAAVELLTRPPRRDILLLHCVSSYPADPADANLRAMETLRLRFDVPVGYSDHTPGLEIPLAAAALGACLIEKHLTLRRDLPGPDHPASLEPGPFRDLVTGIRTVEAGLGDGLKQPRPAERELLTVARRSLVARVAIPAGQRIESAMLTAHRPATGLPPHLWSRIVGRIARRPIAAGESLAWEMFA